MAKAVFLEQPKTVLLRQQVTDSIRDAIVDMRLLPGDQLIDRELVEWLGVSRATVREAIRELVAENLLQSIPQRGVIVASPTPKEAAEIYEIRATLEGLAGRQCAERATPAQVKALRRAFEAFKKAAENGTRTPALQKLKNRIYDAMFDGAENQTIRDVLSRLQARVTVLRSISMSQPGRLEATLEEVERVVRAVEASDAAAAEAACIAHVQAAGAVALAALAVTAQTEMEAEQA